MLDSGDVKCSDMEGLVEKEECTSRRYARLSFTELKSDQENHLRGLNKTEILFVFMVLACFGLFWFAILRGLFVADKDTALDAALVSAPEVHHTDVLSCCDKMYPMTDLGDEICTGQKGGRHTCCLVCKDKTDPEPIASHDPVPFLEAEYYEKQQPAQNIQEQPVESVKTSMPFLDKAPCCILKQKDDQKGFLRCPFDSYNTCCKVC